MPATDGNTGTEVKETMSLLKIHLILVCIWLGLVLVETVIEFAGPHSNENLQRVARYHSLVDGLFELPIVLAVLGTGVTLAWRIWPLENLMLVKVTAGLIAIAANLYCATLVFVRRWSVSNEQTLARLSWHVRFTWIAVPFGLCALWIGLRRSMG